MKKIVRFILILLCLIGMIMIYRSVNKIKAMDGNIKNNQSQMNNNDKDNVNNNDTSNGELDDNGEDEYVSNVNQDDLMNVLLIGQDSRNEDKRGRSDTIMLASFNKKTNDVKLISFMRDLYVEIPGYQDNRINASYRFGGKDLLVETIENNFDIEIDNTVEVDFTCFKKVVNIIGGVEIDVKPEEVKLLNGYVESINSGDGSVPGSHNITTSGLQVLNGTQALAYARIRYVGNGDFERTERQRTIIKAAVSKVKTLSVAKLIELCWAVMGEVETDIGVGDAIDIIKSGVINNLGEIKTYNIPQDASFQSKSIRGMAVLVSDIDACKEKLIEIGLR